MQASYLVLCGVGNGVQASVYRGEALQPSFIFSLVFCVVLLRDRSFYLASRVLDLKACVHHHAHSQSAVFKGMVMVIDLRDISQARQAEFLPDGSKGYSNPTAA